MPNLRVLNLASNDLTSVAFGADPGALQILDLGFNELTSPISEVLWSAIRFPELRDLRLSGNKLDYLKFESNQVPNLGRLWLKYNRDSIYSTDYAQALNWVDISNAPNLTLLDVRGNFADDLTQIVLPANACSNRSGLTCKH